MAPGGLRAARGGSASGDLGRRLPQPGLRLWAGSGGPPVPPRDHLRPGAPLDRPPFNPARYQGRPPAARAHRRPHRPWRQGAGMARNLPGALDAGGAGIDRPRRAVSITVRRVTLVLPVSGCALGANPTCAATLSDLECVRIRRMTGQSKPQSMTVAEFLAWASAQPLRAGAGEVVAMTPERRAATQLS